MNTQAYTFKFSGVNHQVALSQEFEEEVNNVIRYSKRSVTQTKSELSGMAKMGVEDSKAQTIWYNFLKKEAAAKNPLAQIKLPMVANTKQDFRIARTAFESLFEPKEKGIGNLLQTSAVKEDPLLQRNHADLYALYAGYCLKGLGGNKDFARARTYSKLGADCDPRLNSKLFIEKCISTYVQLCREGKGGEKDEEEASRYESKLNHAGKIPRQSSGDVA